ncbi:MAG: glycine rich domain-containing protein [Clostridium sp.]|nr:glycine rich domain-containing protein [Clostridium sp.]
MAELIHKNDYKKFNYTGNIQSIELLPGKYKLEVWGAEGGGRRLSGNSSSGLGGYGGYSTGILRLNYKTTLFVYVGGYGKSSNSGIAYGGWNGGGNGYASSSGESGNGGGGGTDIRTSSSLYSRIIVAGGGGGGGEDEGDEYGHGGDTTGTSNYYPGTQTSAGSGGGFGYGGSTGNGDGGGGGGGWYGGGTISSASIGSDTQGGGGGSGYVYTESTASNYPNCQLDSSYYLESTKMSTGVRTGNGFAKITLLEPKLISCNHDNGIEDIIINSETYEVGDTITLTPILKQGYLWDKWTGDIESINEVLTITIEDDKTLISVYANSKPGPTKYTIKHYTQNLDITTYTLQDTEILDGITNDIVYPDIKTYKGFTSPDIQSITLKNDGTSVLNYYYTRNKYTVLVISNGYTDKSEYYFEEQGELTYDNTLDNIYAFTGWRTNHKINIINNGLKTCKFYMPANDIEFYVTYILNRLNSNIYKNIFPEEVINMDFINKSLANTIISTEDIRQDNHGLSVNDFVYLDDDGLYKKALAEESTRANVVGIVSKVAGPNVFTLMDSGTVSFDHLDYNDTTILYLSDKIPGKAVHYSEISNTIYIPVAVYIEDKIIIHLQQGSIGDVLAPYEKEEQNFENYTEQELNDVINQITNGVK